MNDQEQNLNQERSTREPEEKKKRLEKRKEEIKKEKEKIKKDKLEKEKESNKNITNSLTDITMANPTPEDFFNLREQFLQMKQLLAQMHVSNQSNQQSNHNTQPNFDLVKSFLKSPTTFHGKHNPQKVKLLYDGSNFP